MSDSPFALPPGVWQETLAAQLAARLAPDPAVRAWVVFGSAAAGTADEWSDLDALLVVRAEAQERFSHLDWLRPSGEIYTSERHSGPFSRTFRVCFTDLRRLDIVLAAEDDLAQIACWPSVPFADPRARRVLFSRSIVVDDALAQTRPAPVLNPPAPGALEAMADNFWHKGVLAVVKVMRNDRLIALHLALEMAQEGLTLGMLLRDRTTGTSHHRTGGAGNGIVDKWSLTEMPRTASGILSLIAQCGAEFDALSARWQPDYADRRQPFLDFIETARHALPGG